MLSQPPCAGALREMNLRAGGAKRRSNVRFRGACTADRTAVSVWGREQRPAAETLAARASAPSSEITSPSRPVPAPNSITRALWILSAPESMHCGSDRSNLHETPVPQSKDRSAERIPRSTACSNSLPITTAPSQTTVPVWPGAVSPLICCLILNSVPAALMRNKFAFGSANP